MAAYRAAAFPTVSRERSSAAFCSCSSRSTVFLADSASQRAQTASVQPSAELYLNVWTDACDPAAKKPVLFWIHGGGYSAGSSIEQVCYDGFNLAKKDGLVVVSVNHRLNAFGYLDMSDFGEKYWNSVNVGMADLVEALRWVKENIACFGGDPENVTIFGQSGGGGKGHGIGPDPRGGGFVPEDDRHVRRHPRRGL